MAGPGAIVATLAAIASLGGDHAHHVSMRSDVGHDDFVFRHDAGGSAHPGEVAFASADRSDDHRFHAANAESLVSRQAVSPFQFDAPLVLVAAPLVASTAVARNALPELDAATFVASRHHRSVVLLL